MEEFMDQLAKVNEKGIGIVISISLCVYFVLILQFLKNNPSFLMFN